LIERTLGRIAPRRAFDPTMTTREQLLAATASLRTLEDVTRWAFARGFALVDVVTQDEFTHDVVIAATPPVFLVFDTT
jgi:hypothetical protein